jgi:hypothetical protein
MRFEELAYAEDGRPATVRFDARLAIVRLPEEERGAWVARLLGVLEGTRAGDGASVIYLDRQDRRIWLDRDDRGSATLMDLATGADVPYSAGSLSLDGRFDWFASNGLTSRAASDLIVVDPDAFATDQKYDPQEIEAKLKAARARLTRVEKQHQSALTRSQRRGDLCRRIAELDEQIEQAESARARREAEAQAMTRALARPAEIPDELELLAKDCRVIADWRDELVDRLHAGPADQDGEPAAEAQRELIDEVEPAFVDALAALADACRPFDVIIDAARIEVAGIGAAGIDALTTEVLAEVAARVAEAVAARAGEVDSPPVDDTRGAIAERTKLTQALHRVERNLPDVAELTDKHSALEEEVAALGAALSAGRSLLSAQEAEMFLLRRAGEAGRKDRRREPLPLVVDDALAAFGTSDKLRLLDVVARLTETTQIVYLTDDPDTLAWASDRAADDALPFTCSGYGGSA